MRKIVSTLILAAAVAGCAHTPKATQIHSQLDAIRAAHHGANFDAWTSADRAEFDRLLQAEVAASK